MLMFSLSYQYRDLQWLKGRGLQRRPSAILGGRQHRSVGGAPPSSFRSSRVHDEVARLSCTISPPLPHRTDVLWRLPQVSQTKELARYHTPQVLRLHQQLLRARESRDIAARQAWAEMVAQVHAADSRTAVFLVFTSLPISNVRPSAPAVQAEFFYRR